MNIQRFALLTLSFALVFSIACPSKPLIPLDMPEWPDTEVTHYGIFIGEDSAGHHTSTLEKSTVNDMPVLELTALTELHVEELQSHDSTWLLVRSEDLTPLEVNRRVTRHDGTGGARTLYEEGTAKVEAVSPMGTQKAELEAGPGVTDNDLLTALLRAIDLDVGTELQLKLVVSMAGAVVDATVKRLPDEIVTVPAGTFESRRYEIEVAGQTLGIWYEKAGSRRMLHYEAPNAGLVMELLPETTVPVEQP